MVKGCYYLYGRFFTACFGLKVIHPKKQEELMVMGVLCVCVFMRSH